MMDTKYKNKKICFLNSTMNFGGIERNILKLSDGMSKKGFDIDYFLIDPSGDMMKLIPKNVRIISGRGNTKNSVLELMKYIRREKPCAVISGRDHLNIANILANKLAGSSVKIITSVHVDESSEIKNKKLFHSFIYILGMMLYRKSDHIIAVSRGVAKNLSLRMNLDEERITTIYNPVYDPEEYEKDEGDRLLFRDIWEDQASKKIVGIGRLTEQKRFDILIKAFSIVKKEQNAFLFIFGEGEDRDKLMRLVKDLDLCQFVFLPGYVKNPISYLKKASVFVLSSSWEGFGNVIVEALGAGTPVVSTDCKSGPSEILEDGEYGELVPVEDEVSMAASIMKILQKKHDKAKLQKRAKDFSVDRITDAYINLIYRT